MPNYFVIYIYFSLLKIINNLFGNEARICVAKEISKIHERFLRGTASEILLDFNKNKDLLKGEFILMVNLLSSDEDTSIADKLFENLSGKISNKELKTSSANFFPLENSTVSRKLSHNNIC